MSRGVVSGAAASPKHPCAVPGSMKVILVALVLSLAAVGLAAEPAAACTDPSVCSTLADVKCIAQEPTDTYRALSHCLQWIP